MKHYFGALDAAALLANMTSNRVTVVASAVCEPQPPIETPLGFPRTAAVAPAAVAPNIPTAPTLTTTEPSHSSQQSQAADPVGVNLGVAATATTVLPIPFPFPSPHSKLASLFRRGGSDGSQGDTFLSTADTTATATATVPAMPRAAAARSALAAAGPFVFLAGFCGVDGCMASCVLDRRRFDKDLLRLLSRQAPAPCRRLRLMPVAHPDPEQGRRGGLDVYYDPDARRHGAPPNLILFRRYGIYGNAVIVQSSLWWPPLARCEPSLTLGTSPTLVGKRKERTPPSWTMDDDWDLYVRQTDDPLPCVADSDVPSRLRQPLASGVGRCEYKQCRCGRYDDVLRDWENRSGRPTAAQERGWTAAVTAFAGDPCTDVCAAVANVPHLHFYDVTSFGNLWSIFLTKDDFHVVAQTLQRLRSDGVVTGLTTQTLLSLSLGPLISASDQPPVDVPPSSATPPLFQTSSRRTVSPLIGRTHNYS